MVKVLVTVLVVVYRRLTVAGAVSTPLTRV